MTHAPHLIITIDTEEEFDWNAPFHRHNYNTQNLFEHDRIMGEFYRHHHIAPIMAISYPLLNHKKTASLLKDIFYAKQAIPATHLHPWVTPPLTEELTSVNSYAGNLPVALEREKIKTLTTEFEQVIGKKPFIYKAGRYGLGTQTNKILSELGYKYDLSYFARRDFTKDGGFDYSHIGCNPFMGAHNILHFPVTGFYTGLFANLKAAQWAVKKEYFYGFKLRGFMARLNICDYISLTPEGVSLNQMKYVTDYALKHNISVLQMTYHSSIFIAGATNFIDSPEDIAHYTHIIQDYILYFKALGGTVGGIPPNYIKQ